MVKGFLAIVFIIGLSLALFFPHHTIGRYLANMDPDDISRIDSLKKEFDWACKCQGYRYAQENSSNVTGWENAENKASADLLYSTDERPMWEIVNERNEILEKYKIPKVLYGWICKQVPEDYE